MKRAADGAATGEEEAKRRAMEGLQVRAGLRRLRGMRAALLTSLRAVPPALPDPQGRPVPPVGGAAAEEERPAEDKQDDELDDFGIPRGEWWARARLVGCTWLCLSWVGGLEMKLTVHLHAAGMGKVPAATCLPSCCRLARVPVRGPPRGPLCASQGALLHCAASASATPSCLLPGALEVPSTADTAALLALCDQPTQVPLGARFDAHIAPEQRFSIDAALEAAHAALVKANYLIDTGEVEVGAGPAGALLGGCPGAHDAQAAPHMATWHSLVRFIACWHSRTLLTHAPLAVPYNSSNRSATRRASR